MKNFLKRLRLDSYLSALITIAVGIILFMQPEQTTDLLCRVIGIALLVIGIVDIIGATAGARSKIILTIGVVCAVFGLWIFINPRFFVSLIPLVIGAVMLVHGIKDILLAFEAKNGGGNNTPFMIAMGIVSILLGILCICNSFGVVTLAVKIIGIALIFDGLSDVVVVSHAVKYTKQTKQDLDAIDVEYREK